MLSRGYSASSLKFEILLIFFTSEKNILNTLFSLPASNIYFLRRKINKYMCLQDIRRVCWQKTFVGVKIFVFVHPLDRLPFE